MVLSSLNSALRHKDHQDVPKDSCQVPVLECGSCAHTSLSSSIHICICICGILVLLIVSREVTDMIVRLSLPSFYPAESHARGLCLIGLTRPRLLFRTLWVLISERSVPVITGVRDLFKQHEHFPYYSQGHITTQQAVGFGTTLPISMSQSRMI